MKKTFFKALAATAVVGAVIALSGVAASAAEYVLNADNLTPEDITETRKVGDGDFFTLVASADHKFTVDVGTSGKLCPQSGLTITNRLKTNGKSSTDGRLIQITLTKTSDVLIEGITGKSSEVREFGYAEGTEFDPTTATVLLSSTGSDVSSKTITLAPGTYSFGAITNGFTIYYMKVTEKEESGGTGGLAIAATPDEKYVFVGVNEPSVDKALTIDASNAAGEQKGQGTVGTVYKGLDPDAGVDNPLSDSTYIFAYEVQNLNAKYIFTATYGTEKASVAIGTDPSTETSTEASSESSSETPSEGTTEEPLTESVEPGTYDFAGDAKTELSSLYQAALDQYGKDAEHEFFYKGFAIATATDPSSGHIRVQKDVKSHIRFKVAQASTLKVTYSTSGGRQLKLNGVAFDPDQVVDLEANKEYKITNDTTSNMDVTNIDITAK